MEVSGPIITVHGYAVLLLRKSHQRGLEVAEWDTLGKPSCFQQHKPTRHSCSAGPLMGVVESPEFKKKKKQAENKPINVQAAS